MHSAQVVSLHLGGKQTKSFKFTQPNLGQYHMLGDGQAPLMSSPPKNISYHVGLIEFLSSNNRRPESEPGSGGRDGNVTEKTRQFHFV